MLDAFVTILLISMNNSLGVTIRAKVMPTFLKFFMKLTIVIDFSIEDHKDTLIFVENGLMTTCQVDNREATHPQRDSITYPGPLIIWSSVTFFLINPLNPRSSPFPYTTLFR